MPSIITDRAHFAVSAEPKVPLCGSSNSPADGYSSHQNLGIFLHETPVSTTIGLAIGLRPDFLSLLSAIGKLGPGSRS